MRYRVSFELEVEAETQLQATDKARALLLHHRGKATATAITPPLEPHGWASVYEKPAS